MANCFEYGEKETEYLKGVGVWTAEMILLFCMQRSDVFSYGDLAVLRGLRMVCQPRIKRTGVILDGHTVT